MRFTRAAILVMVLGCGGGGSDTTAPPDASVPTYDVVIRGQGGGSGTVNGSGAALNCTIATGSASGNCAATVDSGTSITLTATPAANTNFTGWGADAAICQGGNPCTLRAKQDLAVDVMFVLKGPSPVATI